jgi:hypothetical protein
MKPFILSIALLFLIGPAGASDYGDYRDTRTLNLPTAGLEQFKVDVGAGSLEIRGLDDATGIEVTARIWIEKHPRDLDKVAAVIDRYVTIELTSNGNRAQLKTSTRDPGLGYSLPHVDLVVTMPSKMGLDIRDRSGFIEVENISGDLDLRDDSGSITLTDITGQVDIDDSSGSIAVTRIGGSVRIDDDSGSIDVEDVGSDLFIEDGSGSIRVRDVKGSVTIRDGSGSINVARIGKDLIVLESGSGSLSFGDIEGSVSVDD